MQLSPTLNLGTLNGQIVTLFSYTYGSNGKNLQDTLDTLNGPLIAAVLDGDNLADTMKYYCVAVKVGTTGFVIYLVNETNATTAQEAQAFDYWTTNVKAQFYGFVSSTSSGSTATTSIASSGTAGTTTKATSKTASTWIFWIIVVVVVVFLAMRS